uniref:Uncharacterized protein n=1 Tax=Timema genevievae TaxID=629358 RepID=A0A7R9PP74_TIMGE|nr:unnamed protein product [Timema genevievae]
MQVYATQVGRRSNWEGRDEHSWASSMAVSGQNEQDVRRCYQQMDEEAPTGREKYVVRLYARQSSAAVGSPGRKEREEEVEVEIGRTEDRVPENNEIPGTKGRTQYRRGRMRKIPDSIGGSRLKGEWENHRQDLHGLGKDMFGDWELLDLQHGEHEEPPQLHRRRSVNTNTSASNTR